MASEEAAEEAAARLVQRVLLDLGGHPAYHGSDGFRIREGVHARTSNACLVKHNVYLTQVSRKLGTSGSGLGGKVSSQG